MGSASRGIPLKNRVHVDYEAIGSWRHSICGPVEWSPNGNLRYGPEVRHENR